MKDLNAALKSFNGAVDRNDATTACTSGQKTLAWMQAANEIIVRPGCMHKKPAIPVDLTPTKKVVANACAQAKAKAKPPMPAPRPASTQPSPDKKAAVAPPRADAKARPSAQDKTAENYASAAVYLRAARSARSVGEYDAAIEAYMQAAQAYGEAGDTALQAEMLAAATELASMKDRKAAQHKK